MERALAASRAQGCVVIVEELSQAEVRFANNTTTTNGVRRDRRVAVVSFRAAPGDGSAGFARMAVGVASGSGDVEVTDLVRASEAEAAGATPADDASPLVDPAASDDAGGGDADGAAAFDSRPSPRRPPRSAASSPGSAPPSNGPGRPETGWRASPATAWRPSTWARAPASGSATSSRPAPWELVARSADGTRSVWAGAGTSSLDFADIDVAAFEARLDRRLAWARRPVELPAGRYEVLLPPDATVDLMVPMSEAMSGRDAEEGRSPFSAPGGGTKLGVSLCPLPFDLTGDPHRRGLESAPFLVTGASGTDVSVFDNGFPVTRTGWLEGGTLRRLRYHRAAAARSGTEPAMPVGNLMLSLPGATASLDDMIASTDRALLLTCLWYIREVDPVTLLLTGLTRDGVYLVEHGEVVGRGQQLPLQREPPRRPRPCHRGRCHRARPVARSGASG